MALVRFVRAVLAPLALASCSGASGATPERAPTACSYPPGPYGTGVGDVVDPSLSWQGYVGTSGQPTTVTTRDYVDCDGSKGVNALVLDQAATWCDDCVKEAQQIAPLLGTTWKEEGVQFVTLMAQDQQVSAATLATALSWRNEFALATGAVCADPGWTMRRWGSAATAGTDNGFPTDVLIDPRTMKIVAIQPPDLRGTVDNLAQANR